MSDFDFRDFILDSVIREEGKIKGFAAYPLYGETSFRINRFVFRGSALNAFMIAPQRLMLMLDVKQKKVIEIVIGQINKDDSIFIRNLPPGLENIFNQLPDFVPHPRDVL